MEHQHSADGGSTEADEAVVDAQAADPYAALLGVDVQEAHVVPRSLPFGYRNAGSLAGAEVMLDVACPPRRCNAEAMKRVPQDAM
jgi:hypothetical protein